MSLKNHFAGNSYGVFENMDINNTLNVDGQIVLNGQTLNPSGGGGGNANIQQVLTVGNDAGGLDLVNVGNLKCTKYLEVGNSINNTSQLHLCWQDGNTQAGNYQLVANGGGCMIQQYSGNSISGVTLSGNNITLNSDGSVILGYNGVASVGQKQSDGSYVNGQIFDTVYNYPYLSTLLTKNNNAQANSINNLNSVQVNNKINMGPGSLYAIQCDNSNNLNFNNGASNKQIQMKSNGDVYISSSGNAYVSNGTTTGQIYDSHFNPPPSGSSVKVVAYANETMNTQFVTGSNVAVEWQNEDLTQQMGTADIVASGNGNATFQNSGSVAHLYNVSGYVTFSNTGSSGSSIALYAVLNNGASQNTQSRIWYDNTTIDNDFPSIPFSFNVVLQPSDFFALYAWTNSGQQVLINGQSSPYTSRIIIAEH
jgi:hypothetical protein